MRFRFVSMVFGTLALLAMALLSDPTVGKYLSLPFGGQTMLILKAVSVFGVSCFVIHVSRKTLFDYLDLSKPIEKAIETPLSAAVLVVGVGIFVLAVSQVFQAMMSQI